MENNNQENKNKNTSVLSDFTQGMSGHIEMSEQTKKCLEIPASELIDRTKAMQEKMYNDKRIRENN